MQRLNLHACKPTRVSHLSHHVLKLRVLIMRGHVRLLWIDLPTPNFHHSTTVLRHAILDTRLPIFLSINQFPVGKEPGNEATVISRGVQLKRNARITNNKI